MHNDLPKEVRKKIEELLENVYRYEKIINKSKTESLIKHLRSEASDALYLLQLFCSDNGLDYKDYYKPLEKHIITEEEKSIIMNRAAEANAHSEALENMKANNIDKTDRRYKLVKEQKEMALSALIYCCDKWDLWYQNYYKEDK